MAGGIGLDTVGLQELALTDQRLAGVQPLCASSRRGRLDRTGVVGQLRADGAQLPPRVTTMILASGAPARMSLMVLVTADETAALSWLRSLAPPVMTTSAGLAATTSATTLGWAGQVVGVQSATAPPFV